MAAELGEAYVNIIPKAPGIEKELKGMFEGSGDAAATKSGASLGKKLLGGLKTAVAAGAVAKVLKDAFEAGGNLQQSFGGLDTIYGDASAAAKEYAKSAASAGISANSYAEQAVSFGAALTKEPVSVVFASRAAVPVRPSSPCITCTASYTSPRLLMSYLMPVSCSASDSSRSISVLVPP